jgi:transcription initiation factor TFIID TATA-box-binding protein
MATVKIVNVVATASVCQKVGLDKIVNEPEIAYYPEKYYGRVAYFKNKKMNGKVSIFSSGKLISVGTKKESQAIKELNLAKKFLIEKAQISDIKLYPLIQNLVVSVDLESTVNLEILSQAPKTIYEPEQFPGAILRVELPFKASILVFANGKAVITGLKSESEIEPTIKALKGLLESIEQKALVKNDYFQNR